MGVADESIRTRLCSGELDQCLSTSLVVIGRADLRAIWSDQASGVVVAVDDRVIAGLISSHVIPLLAEGGCFVRITALCIAEGHRNRGIGRTLVEEIEKRARAVGARLIEVNSSRRPERAAAHSFYPTLGFVDSAHSSLIYRKHLSPDTA